MSDLENKIKTGVEFLQKNYGIAATFATCDETKSIIESHGVDVEKCTKYTTMMASTAEKAATFDEKAVMNGPETISGRALKMMHDGVTVITFVTSQLVEKRSLPSGLMLVDKHLTEGKGSTGLRKKKVVPAQKTSQAEKALA